ncbi:MAG: hypothetical protein ABW022_10020 [Actinoplanes sp.]
MSNLHVAPAPPRSGRIRSGRIRSAVVGAFMLALCLTLAGGTRVPASDSPAFLIAGMDQIPSPPRGTSWAPAPLDTGGLRLVAGADRQRFVLHTAGGERTFLPGVNLGETTPGHAPGEKTISAAQYRAWFAAMSWLGIRVVRIYTVHPPVFYQQLATHNEENPDRPLYLMQGVELPDESYIPKGNLFDKSVTSSFQRALKDAAQAVAGRLSLSGARWDADVTPWLAGWLVGAELDPQAATGTDRRNAEAKAVSGKYFRSTGDATPTERWLAARMNDLAGHVAELGLTQPIAFVNWPTTDPLRHPAEPLRQEDLYQLDANHVLPTADWPAGTFAGYHAYPFYPDFLRHEPALVSSGDPYAAYLRALRKHHETMPTLVTEFGVPSSIGSAHNGPLGRSQGDHSEQEAMRINAELLRMMADEDLSGGFLFAWADEWYRYSWNTIGHADGSRLRFWHDAMTNEQHFGVLAMDATGRSSAEQYLLDTDEAWPARRATARTDEAYLHLDIELAGSPPGSLLVGFDVLPGLTGTPMAGSGDRRPDAVFALNLVGHTGQAYLRNQLDPLVLDADVAASVRGPAPDGWKPFELLLNRPLTVPSTGAKLAVELQNAGQLRYGEPADDSRALWHSDGDRLTIRVPWAMLGFADPSSHRVAVPKKTGDRWALTTEVAPGVRVSVTASGTDQSLGQVTWDNWSRPGYTERLKYGAEQFRDASLSVTAG